MRGVVVDDRLRPQAGAKVRVDAGGVEFVGETGADGRFVLGLPEGAGGDPGAGKAFGFEALSTTNEQDLMVWSSAWPSLAAARGGEARYVVRATHEATLRVVDANGPVADVRVEVLSDSRYDRVRYAAYTSDREGRIRVRGPAGSYSVLVADPRFGASETTLGLPIDPKHRTVGADGAIEVPLVAPRRLNVRVVDTAGAPVAGATLSFGSTRTRAGVGAVDARQSITNADGVAIIERVPTVHDLTLRAASTTPPASGWVHVPPGADSVEVVVGLAGLHTARWPIEPGPARPRDGTRAFFRMNRWWGGTNRPLEIVGGELLLRGHSEASGAGFAVIEERLAARLDYDLIDGEPRSNPTRFLPAKEMRLRILDAQGKPVSGQGVNVSGWYLLRDSAGMLTRESTWHDLTDAHGVIRWFGVFFEPANLKLTPGPGTAAELDLGPFDPYGSGEDEHVVRLRPLRTVVLRVTLDGVAGLREGLSLYAGGTVGDYEADGATGEVRFRVPAPEEGSTTSISMSIPGYDDWSANLSSSVPETTRFDVALASTSTIALRFASDSGAYVDGNDIQLQRWDASASHWAYEGSADPWREMFYLLEELRERGIDCQFAFLRRSPGRYRVVHVPTGTSSEPLELLPGGGHRVVSLAVPATREVKGRLIAPEGVELGPWLFDQVSLEHDRPAFGVATWDDLDERRPIEHRQVGDVRADGTFKMNLPKEATRISIRHPLLRATSFDVPAELEGALEVPVVARQWLSVPFTFDDDAGLPTPQEPSFWGLFDGYPPRFVVDRWYRRRALEGPPTLWLRRTADGTVAWERLERGYDEARRRLVAAFDDAQTVTLAIDVPGYIPRLLGDVIVGGASSTTPSVLLNAGPGVIVSFLTSPANPMAAVAVTIVAEGSPEAPPFHAHLSATGADPVRFTGIAEGKYTLRVTPTYRFGPLGRAPRPIEQPLTVRGDEAVHAEVDLRPPAERGDAPRAGDAPPTAQPPR